MKAIVSLHDVTPATLPQIGELVALLADQGVAPVKLLVVPGLDWMPRQIALLQKWQDAGLELVGHGWHHRALATTGWRHRLHSHQFSRGVAEHLALNADSIAALIDRCHSWFGENGLSPPTLYVPPAWAMGAIPRSRLGRLSFQRYEILSGILNAATGRIDRLPLVGFEADSSWRCRFLRLWNAANSGVAQRYRVPVRIAIHPFDLSLPLAGDLCSLLHSLEPLAWAPE